MGRPLYEKYGFILMQDEMILPKRKPSPFFIQKKTAHRIRRFLFANCPEG
jgi:hypothetical protein